MMMSEKALDAHLERMSEPPEEMVEVEKSYLEYLESDNKALKEYATHKEDCFQAKSVFRIIHCSCGLDALLKGRADIVE